MVPRALRVSATEASSDRGWSSQGTVLPVAWLVRGTVGPQVWIWVTHTWIPMEGTPG